MRAFVSKPLPVADASVIGSPASAAMSREATGRDFFTSLESVRGVAALAVLLIHSCVWLGGDNGSLLSRTVWQLDTTDELARRIILAVFNGNAAVSLFFVLSGFVLALSLGRDGRDLPAKAGAFTARRFLRPHQATSGKTCCWSIKIGRASCRERE